MGASGSYYQGGNPICVAGFNGITISADDVTLDLNGFASNGGVGTRDVIIIIGSAHNNMVIRNGTVRDCGGNGVTAFLAVNSQFDSLRIFNNGTGGLDAGLLVGLGSQVRNCLVRGNMGEGITGEGPNLFDGCTVEHIGLAGITAKVTGVVTNCIARADGGHGFRFPSRSGSVVRSCSAAQNTGAGYFAPVNGVSYATVGDTDFGVNVDPNGLLSGFTWGKNIGWVNFSGGALATPPNAARRDASCQLHGLAWSENIGWINLDDATHLVAFLPIGDVNGDGYVNITDLGVLLVNFGASGSLVNRGDGDLNGDAVANIADLGILLANFGNTCR